MAILESTIPEQRRPKATATDAGADRCACGRWRSDATRLRRQGSLSQTRPVAAARTRGAGCWIRIPFIELSTLTGYMSTAGSDKSVPASG